jgi:hypothetical protein
MSYSDWRSPAAYDRARELEPIGFAWECLRRNPAYRRDYRGLAHSKPDPVLIAALGDGASAFVTDPVGSSQDQAIFWAPEVLPTIVPIIRSTAAPSGKVLGPVDLSAGEIRQASDGWHVLLRIQGVEHRLWLKEPPAVAMPYAAESVLDNDFEIRAHAARRLWRALNGRPAGPAFQELSPQRRQRLTLALRALDGRIEGNNYRVIAEGRLALHASPTGPGRLMTCATAPSAWCKRVLP